MKNARLAIISVGLILLIGFFALTKHSGPAGKCGPYRKDKVVLIGNTKLGAEVAQTIQERSKGLSGRPCIESNQTMLFVFNRADRYPFVMPDMHFPIDIIWLSPDKKVIGIERNVPKNFPDRLVNKDKPALYVLEMRANRSAELGIGLGTQVKF